MNYNLFLQFIQTYSLSGFKEINPNDSLMLKLEQMMEKNNQFFFVGDLIQIKILFASKVIAQMIGIEPIDVIPYHFLEASHPDNIERHGMVRAKLLKMSNDLFRAEKGEALLSTNLKIRNPSGKYTNILFQSYLFYSEIPNKTVNILQIYTDIDWFKKIKHGYHYYVGNDLTNFRYPDNALLAKGNVFTDRQFEIIRLVGSGLSSEQIAEKLFLSTYTVNTHRANILKKSGHAHISDLIYDLHGQGLI